MKYRAQSRPVPESPELDPRKSSAVEARGPADASHDRRLDGASVLIIGAGWLGGAIARDASRRGATVWSMRRSPWTASAEHSAYEEMHHIQGDVTHACDDSALDSMLHALPARRASDALHVVLSVSPSRSRGDTHASLYPSAARGAVQLASALGASTLSYTSSTGVYGVDDGSWVDEHRSITPADARQQALYDAEQIVLHATRSGATVSPGRIVLRVSGLYGPGRDPYARFAGAVPLERDGLFWCNFSWQADVAFAVSWLQSQHAFHRGEHVFNCADGAPVLGRDLARALHAPSHSDTDEVTVTGVEGPRDDVPDVSTRQAGRQRVAVDALRATGWSPTVPDVYAGLRLLGHDVVLPRHRRGRQSTSGGKARA